MFQPHRKLNKTGKGRRGKSLRIFFVTALVCMAFKGTTLHAQNAAAEPRFVDRLFFDAAGTLHVPKNISSFAGGLAGFGIDMRDFNISLTGKFTSSLDLPVISALNIGARVEYKISVMPNFLRILPSVYAGFAQAKGSSGNSGSSSLTGSWIELGVGAELFLTQEISCLARPYYAFSKLGSPPDYADVSALGMDFGIRYFLGQNRRLSY